MNLKELKNSVGKRIKWDFFGMSAGDKNKAGKGKILYINALLINPSHLTPSGELISYAVEGRDGNILEIPQSCVLKIYKR